MNSKQKATLNKIFTKPLPSDISWKDIESLIIGCDGAVSEGNGSRVRVLLNGVRATFHRPHQKKHTDKGAVNSVRKLFENAGIKP